MSTVKTDAIAAVSTNGDLSLDGLGTGGVSIASTLKMTKGGDISSASPLVIDTDGNYFDVTGTTNFAAMTVESGNFFMLQFDGALTITHGSGIELPGAANLTTAAGDRLICYATAADTVEVMSVETEAAAAGGAVELISHETPSGASSVGFTGLAATGIYMCFYSLDFDTDTVYLQMQVGIGGTPTYQTSDYAGYGMGENFDASGNLSPRGREVHAESFFKIGEIASTNRTGNTTGDGVVGRLFFNYPGDTDKYFSFMHEEWVQGLTDQGARLGTHVTGSGSWENAQTAVTAFKLFPTSGNLSGKVTLFRFKET